MDKKTRNFLKIKHDRTFAEGYCFAKIFIFFIIGCLLGTYWEEFLHWFRYHDFSNRQGVVWGPFSPIYGYGVAIFVIFLGKNNDKRSILKTFLYSCLIGGVTEYATSFIADKVFNVEFWDYSSKFLNINGRTTIPFMLFWGLGGLILMKVCYPFISKVCRKIPYKIGQPIYVGFLTFMIVNLIFTYSAFGRQALRAQNIEPFTFYGEWIDYVYDDDYMEETFPVMSTK